MTRTPGGRTESLLSIPEPVAASPQLLRASGLLWMLAALWYLLCEAIAAVGFPGYSYATNYISDLGVPGTGTLEGRVLDSRLSEVMNAGFLGEGLLVALAGVLLYAALPPRRGRSLFLALVLAHAVGISFVGLVPGSPANLDNGLMTLHVLGAFAAIGAGNLAAIAAGSFALRDVLPRRIGLTGILLGVLGFFSAFLLTAHLVFPDGVTERGAVYTVIAWHVVLGVTLLRRSRPVTGD